ncbi:uncharacterized protein LOC124145470 [Haliotis rufescens]|uniref:uncharacterized protein LOC124145470 n=1 Tax=Haliotis rufescens TaxID=6454 RepID=UPI001EAFB006|nr:uncharacterized protein LOC124145470 [Haliotis rufescens]
MTFTPGDLKDVANLVARKLEVYMNKERRETRFQPAGCYRTTKKMQKYDLLQRVMETSDLDQVPAPPSKSPQRKSLRRKSPDGKMKVDHKSRKQDASKERKVAKDKKFDVSRSGTDKWKPQSDTDRRGEVDKGKDKDVMVLNRETWMRLVDEKDESTSSSPDMKLSISPKLKKTSRSVVAKKEAVRLSEYASNVFDGQALDKLQVIHRYRPNSSDIPHVTENGKVQNYTCHVGSALHTKKYVDYYIKEGLQTGRKEYSKRLQELKRGTTTPSEKGSEKGSVQSVRTAASVSTVRSEDYRDTVGGKTRVKETRG